MMPPSVACSPPTTAARSTALPIGPRGASASRLSVAARGALGSSDGGVSLDAGGAPPSLGRPPPRFSFSSTYTPRSQSVASLAGASAARPPSGPAPAKPPAHVLVGFDAPAAAGADEPAGGLLSPGAARRETKPSLLSMALSDLPLSGALSLGSELPSLSSGFGLQVRAGLVLALAPGRIGLHGARMLA
jgi:hypothetical protein